MERRLEISAFRNIGFKDGKPGKEGLILNHGLNKGNLGDLVVLIGANNSGKSNVLDALIAYGNKKITDRDITDLFMEDECRKPSLKLSYKNENQCYGLRVFADGGIYVNYPGSESNEFVLDKGSIPFSRDDIVDELRYVRQYESGYVLEGYRTLTKLIENSNISHDSSDKEWVAFLDEYVAEFKEYLKRYYSPDSKPTVYGNFINAINASKTPVLYSVKQQYMAYKDKEKVKKLPEILNQKFKEAYGYDFEPTIYIYVEDKIGNSSLETRYTNLQSAEFILSVLKSIGEDPQNLINAHDNYVQKHNIGTLKAMERTLNKKLARVAKEFNKLYYLDDSQYSFEFVLESDKIFFVLYRGKDAISLDYQSTGFRWFFDLYFNIFSSMVVNPGDIIVMDEPATNLHVKGQIELRGFLKEFAMKNDVTIVLATHSPFLIDLDFLDELRIVSNVDNITTIDNDFSAINIDDPDSLLPVKESLTVENHVLLDPDQNVVFVEGITDYNYLVAMKRVLGYEDLTFLPIKGVGKKGMQKEISEQLIKIRKRNPFLLVDADMAGKAMKKANEDSELKVMTLSEIDPAFKEIESLFDIEDAKKFGLIDEKGNAVKHHSSSAIFKNAIINDPSLVSDKTKDNFKKVFEAIID